MMNPKSKKNTSPLTELHFISSLALEEAAALIAALADDTVLVELADTTADGILFSLQYTEAGEVRATVTGDLNRWNGTETRVNADGSVRYETKGGKLHMTGLQLIILFGALILSVALSLLMQNGFFLFFIFTGIGIRNMLSSHDKTEQELKFRERDYLLEQIIDAFRKNGDVEILN